MIIESKTSFRLDLLPVLDERVEQVLNLAASLRNEDELLHVQGLELFKQV